MSNLPCLTNHNRNCHLSGLFCFQILFHPLALGPKSSSSNRISYAEADVKFLLTSGLQLITSGLFSPCTTQYPLSLASVSYVNTLSSSSHFHPSPSLQYSLTFLFRTFGFKSTSVSSISGISDIHLSVQKRARLSFPTLHFFPLAITLLPSHILF